MRTEGRADMTKLTVAFRNFANTPSEQEWRVVKKKYQHQGTDGREILRQNLHMELVSADYVEARVVDTAVLRF